MNKLTKFGSVKDIALLALDIIYALRSSVERGDKTLKDVEQFQNKWLNLVKTPGGSHFPSSSSNSSKGDLPGQMRLF
jgi:hypothetical protein